jgi:hypothetical protein
MSYHLSVIRKILSYTWFALAFAALYVGYVFLSRYDSNRKMARRTAQQEAVEAEKELNLLGGRALKIMQLYAPVSLAKGETGKLCYGVVNAKTVTLDPPVDQMWPALTRCIEIKPRETTRYILTATDQTGHSLQQTVLVQVH